MAFAVLLSLAFAISAAPDANSAPTVRARLRGSPAVSVTDYPLEALRNGEQGQVGFELDVAPHGAVTTCRVIRSSGSTSLDGATCRIMTERARFRPARDAAGNGVADRFRSRVTWEMPPDVAVNPPAVRAHARENLASYIRNYDYPPDALRRRQSGEVRFAVEISSQGQVTSCRIIATSGSPPLDQATCRIMIERARFRPARDASGAAVPDVIESGIRWAIQ